MNCSNCGYPTQSGCMCYQSQLQNQANQRQSAQNVYPYYSNTSGQLANYPNWGQLGNLGQVKIYYSLEDALSEKECDNLLLEYKEGKKSLELVQTLWKAAMLLKTIDNLKYLELIELKEIENGTARL